MSCFLIYPSLFLPGDLEQRKDSLYEQVAYPLSKALVSHVGGGVEGWVGVLGTIKSIALQ